MESAPPPRKRAKCDFADLINFEPLEDLPWRKKKSVSEMLEEIAQFMQKFNSLENLDTQKVHDEFLEDFIRSNVEEDEEKNQQKRVNLRKAYKYLLEFKDKPDYRQVIEESMLREANEIILKDVAKLNNTKPGTYSYNQRVTHWKGEDYEYPMPELGMETAVHKLLNRFNSLYKDSQTETDTERISLEKLFKTCSWFVFEMLDLHPFADGNGKLCRLLCSYILSTVNPFPTPIYNVWTEFSKDNYTQALVDARKSEERNPRALLTMIVKCSWSGWKEYLKKLESGREAGSSNVSQDGSVASGSEVSSRCT